MGTCALWQAISPQADFTHQFLGVDSDASDHDVERWMELACQVTGG